MIPSTTKWCRLIFAVALGLSGLTFSAASQSRQLESLKDLIARAEQGDSQAQVSLGNMYNNGQGVSKDYKEAARWYRLSAEQGYAPAQTILGFMYRDGRGVPQDPKEAVRWYRLAAEQGNAD